MGEFLRFFGAIVIGFFGPILLVFGWLFIMFRFGG